MPVQTISDERSHEMVQAKGGSGADCPREEMRRLPRIFQVPLTFLTGKPYTGQRPIPLSPTFHLFSALVSMALGVCGSALAIGLGGFALLLLVPAWAATLHGMRNMRMMIFHQCAHRNMYRRTRLDRRIGYVVSSLLLIQNFSRYSEEHVRDHHAIHHMTLRDPTVQAMLLSLELRPGMTRPQMWRRLLGKLVSPRFHISFTIARIRSFVSAASVGERGLAVALYGGTIALVAATDTWLLFAVAWIAPLLPLFQVSNTLRLCVKHTFPSPGTTEKRGRAYFASLTNAIFLGESPPSGGLRGVRAFVKWTGWVSRMLVVHFPGRYLVLTGDTVCHDFHHRFPSSKEWHNYIFARQRDIEQGHPGWPVYREAWGLVPAIDMVFESLSVADPREFDVDLIPEVSKRELFNAFDD